MENFFRFINVIIPFCVILKADAYPFVPPTETATPKPGLDIILCIGFKITGNDVGWLCKAAIISFLNIFENISNLLLGIIGIRKSILVSKKLLEVCWLNFFPFIDIIIHSMIKYDN